LLFVGVVGRRLGRRGWDRRGRLRHGGLFVLRLVVFTYHFFGFLGLLLFFVFFRLGPYFRWLVFNGGGGFGQTVVVSVVGVGDGFVGFVGVDGRADAGVG